MTDIYELQYGDPWLLLWVTMSLGVTPASTLMCGPPRDVAMATYCCNAWTIGDHVTYTCDPGYHMTSGDEKIYCLIGGIWTGAFPVCSPVSCGIPNSVANATHIPTGSLLYSENVTYECDLGYENTAGDLTSTCQADMTFSGELPTCSAVSCGIPKSVANATHIPTGSLHYSENVTYECDLGYENTAGDLTSTCQADMTFSGELPTCSAVSCGIPKSVANAAHYPTGSLLYSENVTYECDLGYENSFGNLIKTCQADRTFSGQTPTCSAVVCGAPIAAPNASHTPTSSLIYQQTVNYTCDIGYEATDGDIIRTCQANKTFSGNLPTCSVIDCGKPEEVAHAKQSGEIYEYGAKVNYTCEEGYSMTSGNSERICQADKTYSGTSPVCSRHFFNAKTIIQGEFLKISGSRHIWFEHDLGKVSTIARVNILSKQCYADSGAVLLSTYFSPVKTDPDRLNSSHLIFETIIDSNDTKQQPESPIISIDSQYIYVRLLDPNLGGSVQDCLSNISIYRYGTHKMFRRLLNHRADTKETSNLASTSTRTWEPQGKQACSLQCAEDRACLGFNYSPLLHICQLLLNVIPQPYVPCKQLGILFLVRLVCVSQLS